MPITRQQAKKLEEKQRQECTRENIIQSSDKQSYRISVHFNPIIDFIDASKEWRKNKIKGDNCTFEYVLI